MTKVATGDRGDVQPDYRIRRADSSDAESPAVWLEATALRHGDNRTVEITFADDSVAAFNLYFVTFMSSPVLAVLLGARRLAAVFGTTLRLQAPSSERTRVLRVAGLDTAFDIDTAQVDQLSRSAPGPGTPAELRLALEIKSWSPLRRGPTPAR